MSEIGRTGAADGAPVNIKSSRGYLRVEELLDRGSFLEVDACAKSGDGYAEAVAGYGTVEGSPVYVFAQNPDVGGGAMSVAQASKIKKVYALAVKTGAPVVGIFDSVGGRLDEGANLLAAYGEILLHMNNLSGVAPQISLVLGPCTGTSALIAAGADIVVMSNKGELAVGTNGEGGSPEEARKLGLCHRIATDEKEAIGDVRKLIAMLPSNNLAASPLFDAGRASSALTAGMSASQAAEGLCDADTLLELGAGFAEAAFTGIGRLGGTVVGAVALNGVIDADACSKAARFVRFCDSFSIPVITFVNAEKFASLREASKLSCAYSEATAAKLTVITGTACGAVYIAAAGRGANADYTVAWPGAVISALAPETAAVFLHSDRLAGSSDPVEDRKKLIEDYRKNEASPEKAAGKGMIEDIVSPQDTRARLLAALDMLSGKRVTTLPKKHVDIQM